MIPQFSVLMANFNNAKYLRTAINSVLLQNFKDWELIVVDDCSTDNSVEIIKSYKDKRIKFYQNSRNLGYIKTLKKLIKKSQSDIVGILDSDDALTGDAIGTIVKTYRRFPRFGLVYSQFVYCDSKLHKIKTGYCAPIPKHLTNLQCNYVSHFKTFRKSAYYKAGGYDEKIVYAEDKDLILKLEEITKLLFVNKVLYKYRHLPKSHTHDPIKSATGQINFIIAKYHAYKRRKQINIGNISRREVISELYKALRISIKLKKPAIGISLIKKMLTC